MDVEAFTQCLSYIQTTTGSNTYIDKLIPVGTTVFGTALGFTLNFLHGKSKDTTSAKNKLICSDEDIHRIHDALTNLSNESLSLISQIIVKKSPSNHQLPSNISSLCLDAYFTDIAHKYSQNQRYWIQLLLANIKDINLKLSEIENTRPVVSYRMSTLLINTSTAAAFCSNLCSKILTDNPGEQLLPTEIFKLLSIPDELIQAYIHAKQNADNHNKTLQL